MKKVGDSLPLKKLQTSNCRPAKWSGCNSAPWHNTTDLKEFGPSAAKTAKQAGNILLALKDMRLFQRHSTIYQQYTNNRKDTILIKVM